MIDLSALDAEDAYKLITGAVMPRPIAWISTVSESGVANLAPFSFFTVASRSPVMVFISIGPSERAEGGPKDTLSNIRATEDFVVNVVSEDLVQSMSESSAPVPRDVDEFVLLGIPKASSSLVRSPRVATAPIALECRLEKLVPLGTDIGVVGRVLAVHAAAGVLDNRFRTDVTAVRPVGRMPGPRYATGISSVSILARGIEELMEGVPT